MTYSLNVKLEVEVDAPTEFDANEILTDIFGSAEGFGVTVKSMTVAAKRKRKQ